MTHIRTIDLDFTHEDFAQVLPRLIVPAQREIFINDPRQVERLLDIVATSRAAALREFATVLYLQGSGDLAAVELHRAGDLYSVEFNPVEIGQAAHILSEQAAARIRRVVYAHNHPSGIALHSEQDVRAITAQRDFLLREGIELVESVVLGAAGIPYAEGLQSANRLLQDMAAEHERKQPRKKPLQRMRKEIRQAIATLHGDRLEYTKRAPGVLQYTLFSQETNECNGV
jgi:hypothetical protein